MINKIGISNLSNTDLDFFTLIKQEKFITIPENMPSILEIVSVMIIPSIEEKELIENKLCLYIKLKLKLVYLSENEESIHIIEENFILYREIELRNKIEGIFLKDIYRSNRLKEEIKSFEIIPRKILSRDLYFNIYLVVAIRYIRTYSLALLMRTSEFEKNIYICYEDGRDIRQITFEINEEFSQIKWLAFKNSLTYIKKEDNRDIIYITNISLNKEQRYMTRAREIYSYENISSNQILLDCTIEEEEQRNFYIYDINKDKLKKMIPNIKGINLRNPYYRDDLDLIFFIKEENSNYKLCSINSDLSSFNELIKIEKEEFFTQSEFPFIVLFRLDKIMFYNIENNKEINIDYPIGNYENLKLLSISPKGDKLVIVINYKEEDKIFLWDIKNKKFNLIKTKEKDLNIQSICFNSLGDKLIVSMKFMGVYNIYKLDFSGNKEELITPYAESIEIIPRV